MIKSTAHNTKSVFYKFRNKRLSSTLLLIAFLSIFIQFVSLSTAHAYNNVTQREIQLSSSASGSTTAGQGVTYQISFNPGTTSSGSSTEVKTIVVNFCGNDPVIDDVCNNTSGSAPDITSISGFTITGAGSGWAASTSFPSPAPGGCSSAGYANSTLYLTNASAQSVSSATQIQITIPGDVTNPTTVNTAFYGRIFTFNADAHTNSTSSDNYCPGGNSTLNNNIDAGGVALSTTGQTSITSQVPEALMFCIYTAAYDGNSNCSSGSGGSVSLGDQNDLLTPNGPYVDINTKFDVQTNAAHGAIINVQGNTLTSGAEKIEASSCSGTYAGTNPPDGATGTCPGIATNQDVSDTGFPQFGFCIWQADGAATITPVGPYNSLVGGNDTCDTTSQTSGSTAPCPCGPGGVGSAEFGYNINNISSTYGDTMANVVDGLGSTGQIAFVGNISPITPAGLYSTTLTFIATSTY